MDTGTNNGDLTFVGPTIDGLVRPDAPTASLHTVALGIGFIPKGRADAQTRQ